MVYCALRELWFDVEIGSYTTCKRRFVAWQQLWFDVEIGSYTTMPAVKKAECKLWFDVEIGSYTTLCLANVFPEKLWFDVEIGSYTTDFPSFAPKNTLWFDVEIGSYTTSPYLEKLISQLWFDVEIGSYTTAATTRRSKRKLWFDVEIGSYTTIYKLVRIIVSCGLMQKQAHIQRLLMWLIHVILIYRGKSMNLIKTKKDMETRTISVQRMNGETDYESFINNVNVIKTTLSASQNIPSDYKKTLWSNATRIIVSNRVFLV